MIIDEEKKKREEKKLETTKTEEPILKKRKRLLGLIPYGEATEPVTGEELLEKSPLMLYITEDREIDTYKNISTGKITPKDKWGREKGYENIIQSRKTLYWNYDGEKIPIYVHFEKERYAYPTEVRFDAEEIAKGIRIVQANYKEYEEKDAQFKWFNMEFVETAGWLVGGAIVIGMGAIYLGNIFGVWETLGWFGQGIQPVVEETVRTVVENVTNNVTSSGAVVIQ